MRRRFEHRFLGMAPTPEGGPPPEPTSADISAALTAWADDFGGDPEVDLASVVVERIEDVEDQGGVPWPRWLLTFTADVADIGDTEEDVNRG